MLGTMPPELRSELSRMIATDQELVLIGTYPQPGTQDDGPSDLLISDGESWEEDINVDEMTGWSPVQVVLLDDPPSGAVEELIDAGVRAVLPRTLTAGELTSALRAVAAGFVVLSPGDVAQRHRPEQDVQTRNGDPERLTEREQEVLQLMADGCSNKEIANRLGISDHTAKFHVASILSKLGAASRTEAVTVAIRRGVILL